mgnify:CR=1 FL=1
MNYKEAIDKIKWLPIYRYESNMDMVPEEHSDLFKALNLAVEALEEKAAVAELERKNVK